MFASLLACFIGYIYFMFSGSFLQGTRSYPTLVGGAVRLIAGDSSDGVIGEVASHQQSKAAGGK